MTTRNVHRVLAICTVAFIAASAAAWRGDPPNTILGEWSMRTELVGQRINAVMTLFLDEAGHLSGSWQSRGTETPLIDATYEAGALRFKRDIGSETLAFEGTIEDQKITGTYTTSFGDLPVTGERRATVPAEPRRPAVGGGPSLLDGTEKTFIVIGYSTSYIWPAILQDMLDEHAGKRRYHVQNAVVGGSPVFRWVGEPGNPYYEATFGAMMRDYFGEEALLRHGNQPDATIALCQQSLQRTRSRSGPVQTSNDVDGIRIGAEALEQLALQLREVGIETVIIATHIYKKPTEPEVGNERFALKALLEHGHDFIQEGPDVWSLTIGRFPEAFEDDQIHPNELGMKIIAAAWYRTIAGVDARDDIVEKIFDQSYDIIAMTRQYLTWRAGHREDPPTTVLLTD